MGRRRYDVRGLEVFRAQEYVSLIQEAKWLLSVARPLKVNNDKQTSAAGLT